MERETKWTAKQCVCCSSPLPGEFALCLVCQKAREAVLMQRAIEAQERAAMAASMARVQKWTVH